MKGMRWEPQKSQGEEGVSLSAREQSTFLTESPGETLEPTAGESHLSRARPGETQTITLETQALCGFPVSG